jgi:hypothetical protein
MSTTTQTAGAIQMIALSEIRHDQNVRQQLVAEEVDALASSIELLGQLSPVSVRPDVETGTGLVLYLQWAIIRSGLIWGHFSSCCAPFAAVALRITDQTDGVISLLSPA